MKTPKNYIVILETLRDGPVYLGNLGDGNQGVSKLENANRYTERGAKTLAAQYPGATFEKAR